MAYDRINWENTPSHVTPLSAENLNTMDEAIDNIDEELNRVGVKAVNLEARMDTAETNIVGIGEELTEQDTYAKGMGTKTLVHETDIATLKSQVTQIIDGGPASPSELTDVRISENGTAYPTAGEAVRAQVRQMIEVQDTQPTDPGNKLWINDGSYDAEDHKVPTWEEFSELKADLTLLNDAVYGNVDETFPLAFENGTYRLVGVGNTLEKYYGGGHDLTRKVVKATVFNAPCDVHIKAKTGYAFTVYTAVNSVITGSSGIVTEYHMISGQQYGVIVRAANGTTDISSVPISSILDIDYVSNIDKVLVENENRIGLTWGEWNASYAIIATHYHNQTHESQQGALKSSSTVLKASSFIPLSGKMLELPLPYTNDTVYQSYGVSLYDKNKNPIQGRAVQAMPNRPGNDYVVWVHIYIPDNAKYFRTTYWADDSVPMASGNAPEFSYNLLKEIPKEYIPITQELPVDTYMQNAIRRARQITDIKWTPRVNVARIDNLGKSGVYFLDWFYADREYTGIPYSGAGDDETHWSTIKDWGYTHYWVGQHIPFEAFITAARYPNSIMGETVDRTSPSYDSSPYGDVCTSLVNYAVDGPTPLRGISSFFNTSDKVYATSTKTVDSIDFNTISIGDFLYTSKHVAIISDLIRDESGNITAIEVCEATRAGNGNNTVLGGKIGGVARRKMWSTSDAKKEFGSYVLYRRVTFYGIPYIPSDYVDTGNEGNRDVVIDYPCIPYLGNKAIYKVGYIHNSKICIGATGFTSLIVTKDDNAFGTFDITGLTEKEIGFSEAGEYKAYLSDGNHNTIPCEWTVVA